MSRPPTERVVITGCGIVSSGGHSLEDFWANCLVGSTRVEEIPNHWRDFYTPKSESWSPLTAPDYAKYGIRHVDLLSYDKCVLNAVVAADDALRAAHLETELVSEKYGTLRLPSLPAFRTGVFCGTGLGCITSAFENYIPHILGRWNQTMPVSCDEQTASTNRVLFDLLKVQPKVSTVASLKSMSSSISAALSIRYGVKGPNETVMAACAASTWAITRAFESIRSGSLDAAICGGTEYYGDYAGGVFMAFDRLGTLAHGRVPISAINRPFDQDRSGFLFSQGAACMLVLESLESASRRHVRPLAEVISIARTSDANSLVAISQTNNSIRDMLNMLLASANLSSTDIDYINAHGTATVQNDEIEATILGELFPNRPFVNSTKSILGHTIGACGAIEATVTAMSLREQRVHASINLDTPVVDLNFVRHSQDADLKFAITQNFGFGGHNVGILMGLAPY